MTNQVQPAGAIGPIDGQKQDAEKTPLEPAQQDYKEGRNFLDNGAYPQAANAFHNALRGFEEKGDESGVANSLDRLGDTCMAMEKFQLAIDNYLKAYEICNKEEDSFSIVALNKKLVDAHRKLGEMDQAVTLQLDVVNHYHLLHNPKGSAEALITLAELYEEMGDKAKAADAYRTVSAIHKNFKHARMAQEFEEKAAKLENA